MTINCASGMAYRYNKLYVDVIGADDTVAVLYLSQVRLPGCAFLQAMLELYHPDGSVEAFRCRVSKRQTDLAQYIEDGFIELRISNGRIKVRMKPMYGPWKPGGPPLPSYMNWSVVAAAMQVTIEIERNNIQQAIQGTGYADLVQLNRAPRQLGVERLDWGRIHFPHSTIVFDSVTFRNGNQWDRTGCWNGETFSESHLPLDLSPENGDICLALPDNSLTVMPLRVLHSGSAINDMRFPGAIERAGFSLVSGPLMEKRSLSNVYNPAALTTGKAIHETVYFGASAPGRWRKAELEHRNLSYHLFTH